MMPTFNEQPKSIIAKLEALKSKALVDLNGIRDKA